MTDQRVPRAKPGRAPRWRSPRRPSAGADVPRATRRLAALATCLAVFLLALPAFAQGPGAPPAATLSLAAGSDRVTMEAMVSSDGGSPINKWEHRSRKGATGTWSSWADVPGAAGDSMVHEATGLERGNIYYFEVRSTNSIGTSDVASGSIMVAGVPYKPTDANFTVTAGYNRVTLAATTGNGGASISRWQYRQKVGSGNYGSWQNVSNSASSTLSITITGLTNGTTYAYKVRAVNSFGNSSESSEKSATPGATVPAKPDIGLAGANSGDFHLFGYSRGDGGSAITQWNMHIRCGNSVWNWRNIQGVSTQTSFGNRQNINTNGVCGVKIKVRNANGWSPESETKHIRSGSNRIAPAQPENFSATGGDGKVTLAANLPSGSGGATAAKWQYSYKTTGNYNSWQDFSNSRTETLSNRTVTGLTNGTAYTFRVRAHGHRGEGGTASTEITVTPGATAPPQPTLSVAAGDTKVTLTASVADNGGSAVTKWQVARKLTPDANLGAWTDIASSAGNSITGKEVTGLTNHLSYTFAVRAVNGVGGGAQSATVAVTPFGADSSPSFGSATIADQDDLVTTKAMSQTVLPAATGGNGVVTYSLSPALPTGLAFNGATRVLSGTPTAAKSTTSYTYTARDTDGDTATLSFDLTVVQNLTPSFGSNTIADKSYPVDTAITDTVLPAASSGNTPLTYSLAPALPTGLTFDAAKRTLSGTPTVAAAGDYTYTATDNDGDAASLTFKITAVGKVPSAATLSLTAGSNSVTVEASVSSDGGSPITQWEQRSRKGTSGTWSSWDTVPSATGNSMVHKATGLERGNIYYFEVRSTNSGGKSDAGTGSIMVAGVPYKPADADFKVTARYNGVTLAATTGNGGASISRWQYRQKVGTGNYGSWQNVSNSASSTLSTTITGLTNGTTYTYKVRAENSFGNSSESTEKSATPGATVPAKPLIGLSGANNGAFHLYGSSQGDGGSSITGWSRRIQCGSSVWNWGNVGGGGNSLTIKQSINRNQVCSVKIRAGNANGWSAESETKHIRSGSRNIAPAQPENFTAIGGLGKVTLSANLPSGSGGGTASRWEYRYKTTGNYNSWQRFSNSWTETLSNRTVTGLTNGTAYTFQVKAVGHRSENSPASTEITVTPGATAPPKPTLSVAAGDTKVTLTASVADNGGSAITKWQVARKLTPETNLGAWTDIASSAGNSISGKEVTGLTNHLSYTFAVRAVNGIGGGAQSATVAVTPFGADSSPSFGSATIPDRDLGVSRSITAVILPAATGGNGVLTYSVNSLPAGLSFNTATRAITGTPRVEQGATSYTYTARDLDDDTASLSFKLSVSKNDTPSFGSSTIADKSYTPNQAIVTTVLPAANGGNAPLSYSLTPALPTGLKFDAATRTLSGTPTHTAGLSAQYTYTVTDGDGDTAVLTFRITMPDLDAPTVNAASSGYYEDAGFKTTLTGPVNADTDVYVKVTFSEDVVHTPGDGSSARPEISYQVGNASAVRFHIVAPTATLASGDCQPDHATDRDVYECRYTIKSTDSVDFDFSVGTGTRDDANRALAQAYTHASALKIDVAAPTVTAATVSGSALTLTFSESMDTSAGAKAAKSAFAVTVAGSARAVNSYALSGKTATLTLASAVIPGQAVTVAYTKPSGTAAKLMDLAGNELENVSARSVATGPPKPVPFDVTRGDGKVTYSAAVSTDGGSAVTHWQVRYKSSGNYGDWTTIASSAGNSITAEEVTGLTNGTAYTFQVRAVNSIGVGASSDEATETPSSAAATAPPKPTDFTATAGDAKVALTASVSSNNGAAITHWEVRYKSSGEYGDWTNIASSASNSITGKEVTGLANGTAYTFQVRAVNSVGDGATSDGVTESPVGPPPKPATFDVTRGNGKVTFSASVSFNNGSAITYWQVRYKSSGDYGNWMDITGSDANTITDKEVGDLNNGTTYTFQVRAVNSIGDGASSDEVTETPTGAAASAPPKPAVFIVTRGNAKVTLSAGLRSNNGADITHWEVRYKSSGDYGNWTSIASSAHNSIAGKEVTGLTNGTTYTFQVRAVNSVGEGATSDEATETPTSAAAAAPPKPNPFDLARGNGSALMRARVSSNGGAAITHWEYRYRT